MFAMTQLRRTRCCDAHDGLLQFQFENQKERSDTFQSVNIAFDAGAYFERFVKLWTTCELYKLDPNRVNEKLDVASSAGPEIAGVFCLS
jgi:hypothetical protein